MLTLSRKSLHYRIYTAFGLYRWRLAAEPKNLCRYFWATLLGYLLPLVAISLLAILIYRNPIDSFVVVATILGIASITLVMMGLVYLITEVIIPKLRNRYREPNIVWEFIKAKKRKVCPRIQWR